MRVIRMWGTAAGLVVACTACPHAPVATTPVPKESSAAASQADGAIRKEASILRASDRRIVDDDLRALRSDPEPAIRAKAVLALGQIGDAGSVPDLQLSAADQAPEVRASAAFALGLGADPAAKPTLERLAADEQAGVRAAAAEALGRLHEPSSASIVRGLLGDSDMRVRAAAALASWKFAEPTDLLDPLVANLDSDDRRVRMAAAYAIARMTSLPVAPPSSGAPVGRLTPDQVKHGRAALAALVADPEPEVRMQVARGLSSPSGAAELAVVGALSGDKDPRVRVSAVRALAYPGIPIKPYLERAATDRDYGVARAALESLGRVGGTMALEKLNDVLLKLEGTWLREAALTSLTQIDPGKIPDIVEGLLMNPDPVMRAAAAPILAGRKESGAIRAALVLLKDPVPRVQVAAIPLVADQEGPISKLLERFFKAPDPVVRAVTADAVGSRFATLHAGVETRDDLFACLEEIWASAAKDTLPDAKLAVLDALAKAGRDDRAHTSLERGLADADVVVRRRAAARLAEVYQEDRRKEIGPAADRPIEDYEAIVRWSRAPHAAVITMQRPGTFPGRFAVVLDADAAPMAAWNFAELAGKKFFDGRLVHRVVPNFVVQDGDPRGDGYGGPGYSIRDEFNPLPFTAGVLGMASDGKDTAGSQWFITLSSQPHLDGRYTSFGRVTQGLREIVSQIVVGDTVVSIAVYEGPGTEPLPKD